ncbi:MAG TPA: right-handed parallel beta-helix repeat-containing protein, partial [Gemmata sp.]|nr:right-handed parallel beta-helix repeat-containing protein [Gemmata sp.]
MPRRVILPVVVVSLAVAGVCALTARTQPRSGPDPKPVFGTVRDFGATGDGTTDDTAAIQTAVNAAPGTIHFPHGNYRITKTITVDLAKTGAVGVRGDGTARIVMASEGPAFRFVGTHAGTADPKTVKPEVWKERMPCISGLEIVGEHADADAVEATGTMQLTVERLLIRKCRHGIHLTNRNRNVLIANCHVYENRGIGIFLDAVNLHQINVTGCHVSYCDDGGIVCKAGQVRNLHITGCDIESNQGVNRPPTANVLIDSTGGSNAEVAITGCTIQHNHNAAGGANIRIKGPSANAVKGTEEMRDGHVTITGNVLVANSHVYENRGVGIYLDDVNLHQINVTGCHVSYCDQGGIVAKAGEVRNLHITGCDIESNHGKDGPATANVLIDSTGGSNAEVAITGCTIQHNHNAAGGANIR